MDERKLNNDLTKMFCINLYQQETVSELTSAAAYYGLEDRAIHRYQNDALFHAKVDSLVFHVMLIVGNRDSERIAALKSALRKIRDAGCYNCSMAAQNALEEDDG